MKRKFKKTISWLLVTVLLLLSASACSKDSGENSQNDNSDIFYEEYNSTSEPTTDSTPEHLTEVPSGYIGIYTVDDLQNSSLNTDANYILMDNLDLSSVDNWEGITNNSIFDGNNYTISNLKSSTSGLFLNANNIYNLDVKNIDVHLNGTEYKVNSIGWSLGGLACNASKIENCTISGKLKITDTKSNWHIGGITGSIAEGIKNCKSDLEIIHTSPSSTGNIIGGICGICTGRIATVECCEFTGKISAENATIGGICGISKNEIKINGSSNNGFITCNFSPVSKSSDCMTIGGIVGYGNNNTSIENCSNIGDIICNLDTDGISNYGYFFGGIEGKNHSYGDITIHNCYNTATIKANDNNVKVGAILGNDKPDNLFIKNCAYLENNSYGITSTNAMFENCKSMTDNEMKDINNYPFDNINEWKNINNSYPVHNGTNVSE